MKNLFDSRIFYTALLWLLLPYTFLHLWWRALRQPDYLHHMGERFGFYSLRADTPVIWLHAVSVGETRATQKLILRLRETYPHHQILLSNTTPTGRAASKMLYGDTILRVYLPYDYPFAVNRFLRHFRPQLGILMETEIWVNLIHACKNFGTPLLLLSARMSEKSAGRYANFSRLSRLALSELSTVGAQTTDDAARLIDLGVKDISVMGNLKFDIDPPSEMLELGMLLREQFGTNRKIFLAASTREGEEALILDNIELADTPGLLLVIVPRHPQRFNAVADLLDEHAIDYQRRSQNRMVPEHIKVVLGDSMGELFGYYAAADLAFIGGSLLPFGGQNLIESCAVGTPVLIGPHTYNFVEVTRLAVNAGAAQQVNDCKELITSAQRLLINPEMLSEMRLRCFGFVKFNRGATERALQMISTTLEKTE